MEITPTNNLNTNINERLLEQRAAEENVNSTTNTQNIVEKETKETAVKGSSSLQKELLSIMSANQEAQAQKDAQKQLEKGYLDIKV